jgi:hypothetical protein
MVSMLSSSLSVVDRGFEPRLGQSKAYKIGICFFSAKHVALKSKNGWARNQDNVSEWGDMSICGLLFQWANIIKIQLKACWSSTKRISSYHYFVYFPFDV